MTIGAPAYLSPEQLAGETTADERSDLYSLALRGLRDARRRAAVRRHQPGLRAEPEAYAEPRRRCARYRDSVPPAVDALLARCLARLPADRYQSAREAHEALQAAR